MFLVIADDLTGAAEIGGVAHRYGLTVEVQLGGMVTSSAHVVVLDTDTRLLPDAEAARRVVEVASCIGGLRVFKKVDSVLRGPVVAEIQALLRSTAFERALVVPANPSLGRTIEHGQYRINGVPIHETDFSRDPEHPVLSPFVTRMLRSEEVQVLPRGSELPATGIFVGEAAEESDVARWALCVDSATLPVGAASFFAAILARDGLEPSQARPGPLPGRVLLVSGSASEYSHRQIEQMQEQEVPVITMPAACETIVHAVQTSSRVVLRTRLTPPLIEAIAEVLRCVTVDQLWVEGGATASALLRHLGWTRLNVCQELAPGVVALRAPDVEGPLVVLKPGSYPWAARLHQ